MLTLARVALDERTFGLSLYGKGGLVVEVVFCDPVTEMLGLTGALAHAPNFDTPPVSGHLTFTLPQFAQQLMRGAPQALAVLFAPDEAHLQPAHESWAELRDQAHRIFNPVTLDGASCIRRIRACNPAVFQTIQQVDRFRAAWRVGRVYPRFSENEIRLRQLVTQFDGVTIVEDKDGHPLSVDLLGYPIPFEASASELHKGFEKALAFLSGGRLAAAPPAAWPAPDILVEELIHARLLADFLAHRTVRLPLAEAPLLIEILDGRVGQGDIADLVQGVERDLAVSFAGRQSALKLEWLNGFVNRLLSSLDDETRARRLHQRRERRAALFPPPAEESLVPSAKVVPFTRRLYLVAQSSE